MSKLHVLTGDGGNNYTVVAHASTPVGNNSAGIAWNTAVANALKPQTVMTVGPGAGQISAAEANQVASGDVLEIQFQFTDNPSWDSNTRTTQLGLIADGAVTRVTNDYAAKLKWFGVVVA